MDRNRRITSGEQRTRVTSEENDPGMRSGRRGSRRGADWSRDYPFQLQLLVHSEGTGKGKANVRDKRNSAFLRNEHPRDNAWTLT
jgi:hypothetical protein